MRNKHSLRSIRSVIGGALPSMMIVAIATATSSAYAADPPSQAGSSAGSSAASASGSATSHFNGGRESYRLGLYGHAREEFEASLAIEPSPNTRLYLARSLRELGRLAEAAEQLRRTISEAETRGLRYANAKSSAEIELRDVDLRRAREQSIADGKMSAPPPPKEKEQDNAGRPSRPNDAPIPQPQPPQPPPQPTSSLESKPGLSPLFYVSGGISIAGAVGFGALYALASDRHTYLEDHCQAARSTECGDALSTGRSQETIGYVVLGVAVVAATVAVVSLVLSPSGHKASAREAAVGIARRGIAF